MSMRRAGQWALWLAAAALAPACESAEGAGGEAGFEVGGGGDAVDAGGDAAGGGDDGPGEDGAAMDAVGGDGPLPSGPYASRQRFTSLVELPIGGSSEAVTESLVLHEVWRDGDAVRVSNRTCAVSQAEQAGVKPVFGPAFIEALPVTEVGVTVSGPEVGPWDVVFEPDLIVMGAALSDPEVDALPSEAGDPRVVDADEDGKPGLTVKLTGLISGEVWVTQRNRGGMSGVVTAAGRMEGLLLGSSEQTTLGAEPAALASFSMSADKHPDPDKSAFVWVPVGAGTDCAALKAQAQTLFD